MQLQGGGRVAQPSKPPLQLGPVYVSAPYSPTPYLDESPAVATLERDLLHCTHALRLLRRHLSSAVGTSGAALACSMQGARVGRQQAYGTCEG